MACITTLDEQEKGGWVGLSIKKGESRNFQTLDDYKTYTKALEQAGTYCPEVEPHRVNKYTKVPNTTRTGFMEFAPRDPVAQAKFSAMEPTWEGVESSDAAIARGDYSLDSAEANRDYLRKGPQPQYKNPSGPATTSASSNCVVQ